MFKDMDSRPGENFPKHSFLGKEAESDACRLPRITEWEQLYGFPAGHAYGFGYVRRGDGDPKPRSSLLDHTLHGSVYGLYWIPSFRSSWQGSNASAFLLLNRRRAILSFAPPVAYLPQPDVAVNLHSPCRTSPPSSSGQASSASSPSVKKQSDKSRN